MPVPNSAPTRKEESEFISRKDAAKMCAISVQLVDKYINQRRLTPYYFGRAVRILREDWLRLIAEARIEKAVQR
jgi:hypothetical protein